MLAGHVADAVYEITPGTLLHLLAHSLVLSHTAPYLSPSALLSLAATSRAYYALVYGTPSVFRRLDLSTNKLVRVQTTPLDRGQIWRNAQIEQHLTEDEFYSGPLRGTFSALGRAGWLAHVHTLILDHVAVTAELVLEIITGPAYNVRLLSLRHTNHLNEDLLRRSLRHVCRPTRPAGTPRLRGLYFFGTDTADADTAAAADATDAAGDVWYRCRGRVLASSASQQAVDWANTLEDCRGALAFDAVLCRGPRHPNSPVFGTVASADAAGHSLFAMASHAVGGCAGCGSAPEGWSTWGDDADLVSRFPLLWPPPRFSSSLRAAMCPEGESVSPRRGAPTTRPPARFIGRCDGCLHNRMCFTCARWWCEVCMPDSRLGAAAAAPAGNFHKMPSIRYSCRECGPTCDECIAKTQLRCRGCRTGYCIIHHVGSSLTHCDWCCNSSSYHPSVQPHIVALKSRY